MTKLNRQTLGEICDAGGGEIKTGPFGTQLHQSDYVFDGIPVVMPKNIVAGKVSLNDIAQIGEDDADRLKQHRLNRGDIVYGRRGYIGIHALIGQREAGWLCGTGCLRITLGVGPVDPHFLHYYLNQQQVIRWIYNQAIGATMPNLNTSILRSVPIEYPPFPIQRKISGILSAYDHLIENNLRRIKILEEMAQSLYREWFVKFRFPGHEKVRMVDSSMGKIPAGWSIVPLAQVANVNMRSIRQLDGPKRIRYVDISSVSPGRIEKTEEMDFIDAPSRARRVVRHGDTIWSSVRPNRRSYALVLTPSPNLIVSTGFAVLSPTVVPYTFLYQAVTTEGFVGYLTNHATGAAYPAVSAGDFETAELLFPPTPLLDRFHSIVESIETTIHNLKCKIPILRETRDLLLPKLISGEVNVSELDIAVPEEAEA